MKKATSRAVHPSVIALREMPEIDFSRYDIARNPYAAAIARSGISVAHDGPSPRSLAELPEVDFSRIQARRNAYAARARRAVLQLQAGRGRPKRGQEVGPTPARSIRLPMTLWEALEDAASSAGTTVHALLRLAVANMIEQRLFMDHVHATGGARRSGPRPSARARAAGARATRAKAARAKSARASRRAARARPRR